MVDENLSQRVAVLLAESGHDAVHVGDLGLLGADDDKVLEAAVTEGRTLVTADTDFGAMLALSGSAEPSVLLLRGPGRRAEQRVGLVLRAIEASAETLEAGAIVVVESNLLRIRILPVNPCT
jgi:predicted nuclease of predicted toxin-antitoxin system